MLRKKIVCLGAGSLYFLRAIPDLLISHELNGSEIVLYDIDAEKLRFMCDRMSNLQKNVSSEFSIRWTIDVDDALSEADFVISSIGGGGADISENVYASKYQNNDFCIAQKYGIKTIIGDTCGPAAMMMAFRLVPVYVDIGKKMERLCPRAIFINHSNPMAVLCRALDKYTSVTSFGMCHAVQCGIRNAANILGCDAKSLECRWIGTNHYYWFTHMKLNGLDVINKFFELFTERNIDPKQVLSAQLSKAYGYPIVYADDSHIIEFYNYLAQNICENDWPDSLRKMMDERGYNPEIPPPSGDIPSENEKKLFFKKYKSLLESARVPASREHYINGEGLGSLVSAIATGRREVCILNLRNNGAIPNLPAHAIVELEAITDSSGARAVCMGEAPNALQGFLAKRIAWQESVVDAAETGDRSLALQVLLMDEQSIMPAKAESMLDEMLLASKPLLGRFFEL